MRHSNKERDNVAESRPGQARGNAGAGWSADHPEF